MRYLFKSLTVNILFALIFLLPTHLLAGGENIPSGARSAGLGGVTMTVENVFAANNNQAILALLEKNGVGVSYRGNYGIQGLSDLALGARIGLGENDALGIAIHHFGDGFYNEQKIGIAYSRAVLEQLAIAIQLDYLHLFIQDYGDKSWVTFEASVFYRLNDVLNFGVHVYNPIQTELSDFQNDRSPAIFRIGAAYVPADNLSIHAEVEKNIDEDIMFKLGLDYRIAEVLSLRMGYSTEPSMPSAGFALHFKDWELALAGSIHPQLGLSPVISMEYAF